MVSFSDEEAAKILILIDIVRCPPAQVNQHIGKLMRWFYDRRIRLERDTVLQRTNAAHVRSSDAGNAGTDGSGWTDRRQRGG